jgi:predicted regulator of Ras-like GTPase activity (Roadblock/LC7/MglB family)
MFRELLQEVVDGVEGGIAGLLMGLDGIAVESYARDGAAIDITTIGMEYSGLIGQIRHATEQIDAGTPREVAIRAEKVTTLIRFLNDEYFVALAIEPHGNYGKGRYLLRITAPKLLRELS